MGTEIRLNQSIELANLIREIIRIHYKIGTYLTDFKQSIIASL